VFRRDARVIGARVRMTNIGAFVVGAQAAFSPDQAARDRQKLSQDK
jgi:hypothetical protein